MTSWFISPWEAARLSLEAQRLTTLHFLRFFSGPERQRQDVPSDEQALVPGVVDQSVVASAEPAMFARSMATRVPKTMSVRKATRLIRTPVGIKKGSHGKVKGKRSKRKGKSRG